MQPIVTDVLWFLCLLDIIVSSCRVAELIEMPFGLRTQVGPRNCVLGGAWIPPGEGVIFCMGLPL